MKAHEEEEMLPEDVPSIKFKGMAYRADKKIGEGG